MRHSAILFLFIATVALEAQTADISITALPSLSIPLGPTIDGDLKLFGLGGGGSFRTDVVPGTFQWLYGRFAVSMDLFPLNNASTNLNVASFGGGLGLNLPLHPRVVMKAGIGGGLYLASSDLGSVRDPYIEASAGLSLRVRPTVGIEAGAGYRQLFTPTGTLYQGITIQLGLSYDLAGSRRGNELYIEPLMKPVFPLFYTWYDHHPAGEIALENRENVAYERIKVSFWAKQFMDAPRLCGELPELKARSSATIPVYALFNSSIFKVTEGTKAAGEFLVEYYFLGDKRTLTIPVTLVVENRNAMTWDDDRKAAAFITAKDPVILGFARNVAGTVRYEGTAPVSENFRTAFAIFQTLSLYGLGYAVDPQTPFAGRSADEEAIDFLQFPKQTLAYRGGDCDDLSVLYAALLESVGVPSALVTTPGHIFVAFNTGLAEREAEKIFSSRGDMVMFNGEAWIPVEVTLVKEGFVRSWRKGAQEWREAKASARGAIFPVREAWELYEPVGFTEDTIAIVLPSPRELLSSYRAELLRFYDMAVAPRIAETREQAQRAALTPEKSANRLGVLYGQFGMLDRAEEQFREATKVQGYAPAITNLGNVLFLKGDMRGASSQFQEALRLNPKNTIALAGFAKTLYALEDFPRMEKAIENLKALDEKLADSLDLSSAREATARASDAGGREVSAWDE